MWEIHVSVNPTACGLDCEGGDRMREVAMEVAGAEVVVAEKAVLVQQWVSMTFLSQEVEGEGSEWDLPGYAVGGSSCCLWGETTMSGWGEREGKEVNAENREGKYLFCLFLEAIGAPTDLYDHPIWGFPYQAVGTPKTPSVKYTPSCSVAILCFFLMNWFPTLEESQLQLEKPKICL